MAWAGRPLLNVIHPAFPLPTAESLTLQGALLDDFERLSSSHDMPNPCQFPCLDGCQRRKVDLTPYAIMRLTLQAGDAEEFFHTLQLEMLG